MIILKLHAVQRMTKRKISLEDIAYVLDTGEIIEEYPDDQPFPSRLMLGFCGTRPVHVVVANHPAEPEDSHIITVYEPNIFEWDSSFRRRKGK